MTANDNHCADPDLRDTTEKPAETCIEQLGFASQFVIWVARAWVTALKSERDFAVVSGGTFLQLGLDAAEGALDEFFLVVAHSANRQIDIRCLKCRQVSPDELVFHRAVAAAQNGLAFQAYHELRCWLAPAAARLAFAPLMRLGMALARGKLLLPAPAPETASSALPDLPMPSRSLH
ncbi:hypothetical protein [Dongia mobilis]|uniref:hypothetical protein n=1 Tax=Dongia mobilis TaxID=578943 RepID=UPI00105CFD05|nr:hypothetical protein [Dongia mobilis]